MDSYSKEKLEGHTYKFGCSLEGGKRMLDEAKSLDLEVVGVRYVQDLFHSYVSTKACGIIIATYPVP